MLHRTRETHIEGNLYEVTVGGTTKYGWAKLLTVCGRYVSEELQTVGESVGKRTSPSGRCPRCW